MGILDLMNVKGPCGEVLIIKGIKISRYTLIYFPYSINGWGYQIDFLIS